MKKLLYLKRSKCSGCAALIMTESEDAYECKCTIPIDFKIIDGKPTAPKPMVFCYKPTEEEDVERASKLTAKRRG